MKRYGLPLVFGVLACVLLVTGGAAAVREEIRDAVKLRYPRSRIQVEPPTGAGRVVVSGAILRLEADGVSAKRFRVIRPELPGSRPTLYPWMHVHDYARVDISDAGVIRAGRGGLMLPRGTRLVVLDLEVDRDRVRLFTHTAEPVAWVSGRPVYGCTEFVFRFDGGLEGTSVAEVERTIDRWLPLAS